ncbi:MAG: sigma-70 family RNA polymerase sigma factor [Planctomycetes bacterium]|nr:sigma-70 family RNA polymerase sigma factor [Planctomycetota bacterium]
MQTYNGRSREASCDLEFEESELLQALRAGEEPAYERFVRQYGGAMQAVARRFLRCEQDAADAVQEAFLSAFRSIRGFAGDSKIGTWLHRIVVNACLMKLRAGKSRPVVSIESLLPSFDETGHHANRISDWNVPSHRLEADELRATVRRCIDELPDPFRVVLLLRDIEELNTQETAERLRISEPAVKVRLHRARQALRTLLDPTLRADREHGRAAR